MENWRYVETLWVEVGVLKPFLTSCLVVFLVGDIPLAWKPLIEYTVCRAMSSYRVDLITIWPTVHSFSELGFKNYEYVLQHVGDAT